MSGPLRRAATLALFLVVSLGGGLALGTANRPGAWYASLEKPWFNPPDWVFGPAWTILYVLVAIAGWRVFEKGLKRPFGWWCLQIALNFAWTPLFFTAQRTGGALLLILLLLGAVLAFAASVRRADPPAAWLFVPYALWVAYAALLNAALWWLN